MNHRSDSQSGDDNVGDFFDILYWNVSSFGEST